MREKNFLSVASTTFVATAFLLACMSADANSKVNNAYRPLPFPSDLERYETPIFNLFDKDAVDSRTGERQYDIDFVRQFKTVIKPYLNLDSKLERKLFSGPAPEGSYIEIRGIRYLFYTICQAHACNTTNIAILYQPTTKKISGRLQYKCGVFPLNSPQPNEAAAIEALSPINTKDPFYQESCNYEKQGAK